MTARGQLHKLNLIMLLPPIALVGVLIVVIESQNWRDVAVLGLGVAVALVGFVRWAAGEILRVALPCLVVAGAVWLYGALVVGSGTAYFGLICVGPLVVPQLSRHRGAAIVGLATFVGAVGAARLLVTQDDVLGVLIAYVIVPTGITIVVTGLMFPNKRFYDVVTDLEESREREAELAVVRERMRFASDLHDIQGHTLHVVKLKTVLAQRLVRIDPERAEQELQEIRDLVADTIAETKELAYAQRRLNLTAELENAKNLFEAAGIRVRVDRDAEFDSRVSELLGQVLRETTTNILRHAQAEQVRITLSKSGITIVNDGAPKTALPALSGLATLKERLAGDGGELTVAQQDGRFTTAATFPRSRPDGAR